MNSPNRTTTFCLDGAQTVRTIETTCDKLRQALESSDSVAIQSEAVGDIDLSLIQLLLAAKRSAERAGKSLTLVSPVSARLEAALRSAGIRAKPGGPADEILWLREVSAR